MIERITVPTAFAVVDIPRAPVEVNSPMLPTITQEILNHSVTPPKNDPTMGAYYTALHDLLNTNNDVQTFMSGVLKERKFTPQHFVNLVGRVIQFNALYQITDNPYPHNMERADAWKQDVAAMFTTGTRLGEVSKELLLTKDTGTTVYQRYVGPAIVLNTLYSQRAIDIADFGCGGNYGLPGMMRGIPFATFTDDTPGKFATDKATQQVKISKAIALDKEDPYHTDTLAWRLACLYPHELAVSAELAKTREFETEMRNTPGVEFRLCDLLTKKRESFRELLPPCTQDAVILSTILYQMDEQQQQHILGLAESSLKDDGVMIVQDFAEKDPDNPRKLHFIQNWHEKPWSYRTFVCGKRTNWEMKEVLRAENGRSKAITEGEDFDYLLSANAA